MNALLVFLVAAFLVGFRGHAEQTRWLLLALCLGVSVALYSHSLS